MDTSERITIRLDRDILARMDAWLKERPGYASRSQLCRAAVRQLLESLEGRSTRVTAEIPASYLDFLDALIQSGYFLSREQAVRRLIEEGLSRERVKEILAHQESMGRASGKIFPVELEEDR
ncbi:MAG: ribbon-helix-helix domain-containing protein [Thermoplasmata archaeon]